MDLTPEELQQLLRLSLAALRAQAGGDGAAALPAALQAAAATVPAGGPTLSAWLQTFERIIAERGYKAQTLRNRRTAIAHIKRLWGDKLLRALKPYEISSAIKAEFLPDHTSTARRVLAELRDVYTEAVANGEAEHNPVVYCRAPVHRVCRQRLTLDTWRAMLQLARTGPQTWVVALLLLALITGQRRGDLAKMRFDDIVELDGQQYLRVEQEKQAGKGYGARVEIPLSLRLDAIGMSLADVIEVCRQAGKPGPTLLRKAGGGPIEVSSLSARFAEVIAAVMGNADPGARIRPSLHEVRSLAARLYHAQGVDVQTLLGHKHAEMTEVYRDDRGLSAHQWKRVQPQDRSGASLASAG